MSPSHDNGQGPRNGLTRIIVVDDEPTLRLGFEYTLTGETTTVSTAADGRMALEMATARHFDLMILDLRMPEMDGIEVIKAVRASGNLIPIILCSAGFTPKAVLDAIRNGVAHFLFKPLRPAEIRHAVRSLLNPGEGTAENALKAVRPDDTGESIRLLQGCSDPSPREAQWLGILELIRDTRPGDAGLIEEAIGASLPLLAMNPQPTH